MEGKHIIVIGGGTYRMRNMWSDAEGYGIKIILVEYDPNHIARDFVHCFVEYDFSDHTIDHVHASEIISLLRRREIKADGCVSFCNECTPLAALICEQLELRGPSFKSAIIANSKSQTQNLLKMSNIEILGCKNYFQFPAILKLDNCSGGIGACMVESKSELKNKFQQITSSLCTDSDFPRIGLSRGNSMTTFEFYNGTEHNVDVMLYDKTLVWAFITDSGIVRQPYFIGTAKRMPSFLPDDSRNQLIDAAYKCCIGIGLTDGTFNVEFIMTANGPKLVEINPRMCGYVFRDWIMKLYGIDIMLYTMMISCGIKPELPNISTDIIQMGVMVIPSLHGKLLTDDQYRNKLNEMIDAGDVTFLQFLESFEHLSTYDKPFGNVAVSGTDSIEVKTKLMNVCRALDIDQHDYQVDIFIRNF
ncbi:carnosine synthase 1-like [Ruditapes philippinarum]|uniref:carnosine synthase 1-like n=1 Tax=Ruditapes philippinarum TaxID=129788 RepID=UPI00295B5BFD|nr:carnosine synthase 1-like [Ruditapes philippinarum]